MLPCFAFKLIDCQYFTPVNYESIVENFLDLQPDELEAIIQSIINQLPAEWETPKTLGDRMVTFLSDPARIRAVKHLTIHSLKC